MNLAAFTGSERNPSSRFRLRQLMPALGQAGIRVTDFGARFDTFPPATRWVRPFWAAATLASRLPQVVRSHRYDAVFLQREMLSTFRTWEPITGRPRLFDVDDAIFLYREGRFARSIAAGCDLVIAGNTYLADWFAKSHTHIRIIPTAVDTDRFVPGALPGRPVIGWSGSSSGLSYLYALEAPLAAALAAVPDAVLRVVCDRPPVFRSIAPERVEYVKWSPEAEVSAIQGMTVGLMPLDDTAWSRGKCAYKMLLYMSCGVPAVVSPVGMNTDVLGQGEVGFGPTGATAWTDAIVTLLREAALRDRMARNGRRLVEQRYSIHAVAPQVAAAIRSVVP